MNDYQRLVTLIGERDAQIVTDLAHVYGQSDAGNALKHLLAELEAKTHTDSLQKLASPPPDEPKEHYGEHEAAFGDLRINEE